VRELIAEIRQHRQLARRLQQRITGKQDPAPQENRQAQLAIPGEAEELEGTARIVAEHYQEEP
jgi:hypothetical protein